MIVNLFFASKCGQFWLKLAKILKKQIVYTKHTNSSIYFFIFWLRTEKK